jgi:hypothetical protein
VLCARALRSTVAAIGASGLVGVQQFGPGPADEDENNRFERGLALIIAGTEASMKTG